MLHWIKNGKTWVMEVEGLLWTGAFEISGKNNCVSETVHQTDVLYDERMTNKELEWCRRNHLFVMSHFGHSLILDELNDFF